MSAKQARKGPLTAAAAKREIREQVDKALEEHLREIRKQTRKLEVEAFKLRAHIANAPPRKPRRGSAADDPAAQATQRYREKMRSQGMKLVQLWVPDPEAPGYREECRRQIALIAKAAADPNSDEAAMNRMLAAHADQVLAGEPEYDWGPEGPPK